MVSTNYEEFGIKIQGSDQIKNKNTVSCSKSGIKVFIGHSKNIKNSTIIVRSWLLKIVIMKLFMPKKIPIYSRAEVLADVVSLKNIYYHRVSGRQPLHLSYQKF